VHQPAGLISLQRQVLHKLQQTDTRIVKFTQNE